MNKKNIYKIITLLTICTLLFSCNSTIETSPSGSDIVQQSETPYFAPSENAVETPAYMVNIELGNIGGTGSTTMKTIM